MLKVKKGVSLIECVTYMAVLIILSCILIKIIINTDYLYTKTIQAYSRQSDVEDVFANIERFINEEDVSKIEVKNNNIIIYKGNLKKNFQKEEIFKDNDKLIIKYYDIRNFEDYNTRNTLGIKIQEFKVNVKGKLIYIMIKKGGKEYIKCL